MSARFTCLLLALLGASELGCGYGATVQERGSPRQAETLRILNRQLRVYDCEGLPPGSRTCQYMRFQVAVDEPEPASEEAFPAHAAAADAAGPPAAASAEREQATVQMVQQALQGPDPAPQSPDMSTICAGGPSEMLTLKYDVLKYPSPEVTRHADRLDQARSQPVQAQLQQRPFLSRVGLQPRWSVDSERVKGAELQRSNGTPRSMSLEICDGKRVANLDLVLLDEQIDWHATGDVYRLEVWREKDRGHHRTVETLNTVAQYGLGSWLAGMALIGVYIFFGATR